MNVDLVWKDDGKEPGTLKRWVISTNWKYRSLIGIINKKKRMVKMIQRSFVQMKRKWNVGRVLRYLEANPHPVEVRIQLLIFMFVSIVRSFFFVEPNSNFHASIVWFLITPHHLLLDRCPNIGPLISHWGLEKFKNCWYKSVRIL